MNAKKNVHIPDGWTFTEADTVLAEEVQGRLPSRLFDVHVHLYGRKNARLAASLLDRGPAEADYEVWREHVGRQVGTDRLCGALLTPFPAREGDAEAANDYVAAQVEKAPGCRAAIAIGPEYPPSAAEARLQNPKIRGFEPCHPSGPTGDPLDSRPEECLPAWAWEVADERQLVILLNVAGEAPLADLENCKAIRRWCERYPNARLILAHLPNAVRALPALRGLENVWFDTSGVCEADAPAAILSEFGPRRLLWGSGFPLCQRRGRCITLGNGFAWVTTDLVAWNEEAFHGQPVLVGLESVRAVLNAADSVGLADQDLKDIFCDNALRLLGLKAEPTDTTHALYRQAKEIIPGGVQLLSKRPEMSAPDQWPAYFSEARGCEIWDLDGKHYYDVGTHGIGACILGFKDPDVTRAVQRRLVLGSFSTLSPPEEVELARLLCELHPWAEQVRYARTGGEIMSVAVRIARATTDRSAVAICGYHGWHDWYLAANLGEHDALRGHLLPGLDPLGVPSELRGTNFTFTYNNREQLQRIVDEQGHRLAAIVMEPCRYHDPEPGFLEFVRQQADSVGAVLIFDEITIGWRLALGGAHLKFGVAPDMAAFAKTMSNGHPMAAVIGTRKAMEGAHSSFISSTYWTESIGPVAALATIRKMQQVDVPGHCERIGRIVQSAWRAAAERHGVPVTVEDGYGALAHFAFEHELANELRTLYVQLMLERGFLAKTAIYVTLAHTDEIIEKYTTAIYEVFGEIADALSKGEVSQRLKGPVAHTGFRRLL